MLTACCRERGIFKMMEKLPQEWLDLSPEKKGEVLTLLRRVGIEGVRELLDGQLLKPPSKAP